MERIGSPQVLLLADHLRDGEKVERVLDYLEALNVIRTERMATMVLGFFAERQEPPATIVLFMNSKWGIGIYPSSNFRLLQCRDFGVGRLSSSLKTRFKDAQGMKLDLVETLSKSGSSGVHSAVFDN